MQIQGTGGRTILGQVAERFPKRLLDYGGVWDYGVFGDDDYAVLY